jgi:hypothetical protein
MSSVQLSRPRVQPSWRSIDLVGRTETPGDDEVPIVFDGSPGPDLGEPIPPRPAKVADPGDEGRSSAGWPVLIIVSGLSMTRASYRCTDLT